jgi:hypothetical protein
MEVAAVQRSIAGIFFGLVDGISGVVAWRKDSNDVDETEELKPVIPVILAKL